MMTGKLPNHLIKAVFDLVQANDNFHKYIGSSLNLKEHLFEDQQILKVTIELY